MILYCYLEFYDKYSSGQVKNSCFGIGDVREDGREAPGAHGQIPDFPGGICDPGD